MSLKEKLMDDLKTAMKDKDEIRKNTVQMTRAAILQVEKDKRIVLGDEEIIDVIYKELKKRKDTLPDYENCGRKDLVDILQKEISILEGYLPQQLSPDELDTIVKETIALIGAVDMKDIGKVMSAVLPKVKGRADGRSINEIAKKYLNN